jgi:glutamine amidotransferase
MIAIIDYGMGNLRSVQKAFEAVGADARVTRAPQTIADADHVVLPGVGAFGDCMANLERLELIQPVRRAIASGKPFLGICLGLQLLFTESEEFGLHKGLGIISGKVRRFATDPALKVPHMGWNAISVARPSPVLAGIDNGAYVYFVHSYYVQPDDPAVITTRSDYGVEFVSSIGRDNLFACQFHPEKSQDIGLRLIHNFTRWQ